MKNRTKHALWKAAHFYSYLAGFPALAKAHEGMAIFALHGLGYDNRYYEAWTGEYWFIKHVLPAIGDATCIDIGAHIGSYSKKITEHVPGEVFSIEPLSSTFAELHAYANKRMHPVRLAITDFDGKTVIVSRGEKAVDATLLRETAAGSAIEEEVPVLTLDSFIAQQRIKNIGFVKIDTEGNEMEVLKGMQKLIHEHPPAYIQFEFNFQHVKRGHTLFMLTKLLPGYTFYRLLSHGMLPITPDKWIDNLFMYSNIIAKRNDEKN